MKFEEARQLLKKGKKVRRRYWSESYRYIYFDLNTKEMMMHLATGSKIIFRPIWIDFETSDWIEVEE